MDIYPDTLEKAFGTWTLDVDLATATVDVYLDGAWRTAAWSAAATHTDNLWTRPFEVLLAGANPGTGIKPTAADQYPLVKVTVAGEVIIRRSKSELSIAET